MGAGASTQSPHEFPLDGNDIFSPPKLERAQSSSVLSERPTALAVSYGLQRKKSFCSDREAAHESRSRRRVESTVSVWKQACASGNKAALRSGLTKAVVPLLSYLDGNSRANLESWAKASQQTNLVGWDGVELVGSDSFQSLCGRSIGDAICAATRSEALAGAMQSAKDRRAKRLSMDLHIAGEPGLATSEQMVRELSPQLKAIKIQEPLSPQTQRKTPEDACESQKLMTFAIGSDQKKLASARPSAANLQVKSHRDERIERRPGHINGWDFNIDDCHNCTILVMDHASQVFIDRCTGCSILLGAVGGSVFLRECFDCVVRIVCQQFRTRHCSNCDCLLWIPGHPIIETSLGMRFGAFGELPERGAYKEHLEHVQEAGLLEIEGEHWWRIFDFSPEWCSESEHFSTLSDVEQSYLLDSFPIVAEEHRVATPKGTTNNHREPIPIISADSCGSIVESCESAELTTPASRRVHPSKLEPLPFVSVESDGSRSRDKREARRKARAAQGVNGIGLCLLRQLNLHPDSNMDHRGILARCCPPDIVRPHLATLSAKLGGEFSMPFLTLVGESFVECSSLKRTLSMIQSPLTRSLKPLSHRSIVGKVARIEQKGRGMIEKGSSMATESRIERALVKDISKFERILHARVTEMAADQLRTLIEWARASPDTDFNMETAEGVLRCVVASEEVDHKKLLPRMINRRLSADVYDCKLSRCIFRESFRDVLQMLAKEQLSADDISAIRKEIDFARSHAIRRKSSSEDVDSASTALRTMIGGTGEAESSDMQNRIRDIFRSCDRNGDGKLSVKDLAKLFKEIGMGLSGHDVSSLLREADTNEDGEIDFHEFITWLYNDDGNSEDINVPVTPPTHTAKTASSSEDAISYDSFSVARARLQAKAEHSTRFQDHLSALTFLALDRCADSQINVESLLSFIVRRANLHACFVELSMYDTSGKGYLHEIDVENFMAAYAENTDQLYEHMEDIFMPFYVIHATRRIFFQIDVRRTQRIRIKDLVCSTVLSELQQVRSFKSADSEESARNWFSVECAMRVYSSYVALDNREKDGMLSRTELAGIGSGMLTECFLDTLMQEVPTFGGLLDYKGFLDFILAYENPDSEQAIRYFWRIICGSRSAVVTAAYLKPFVDDVLLTLARSGTSTYDQLDANVVLQELWDMIGCQCGDDGSLTLRLADLLKSPMGGKFMLVLADAMAFWMYDNRESLLAHQNHS